MSDAIKHECGVAFIRLLKPHSYYKSKYGSARYGLHKMYQIMEKMINRGQDGAGVATIKLDTEPGYNYIDRMRSVENKATQHIFGTINDLFIEAQKKHPEQYKSADWQKENIPFLGEMILGHLRYGTFGGNTIHSCHPFRKQNNWKSRSLVVAGNFNLTNVDELFDHLVELGQHPREKADTVTVMEKIGHFLDRENDRLFREHKETTEDNRIISQLIHRDLDLGAILKESGKRWDGGYVMCGMIGHGDAFVIRDPNGIRPCYVYKDEEVIVIASERPVIQTVFNVPYESVKELPEGHAAIIKKDGTYREELIVEPGERKACSFERIYFSRGNDAEIYSERKALGKNLTDAVLRAINYDLKNTVFSYIPNTAEIAFHGLVEGLNEFADKEKLKTLQSKKNLSEDELKSVLSFHPRVNKVILKDAKQRTFITADESRDSLVNLGYDISYGTIVSGKDTLVVLDDSIVRGTTLKKSILSILDRLKPKKIIVVSSAPQIRYPDCYGIDMAVLGKFVAFDACMALLKDRNMEDLIDQVYQEAKAELEKPKEEQVNVVDKLYKTFTTEEISKKIAELIRPSNLNAELEIIYQSIEGLHNACPNHLGDWYFTGKFPTPGGVRVSNRSFVNYMEGKNVRAY